MGFIDSLKSLIAPSAGGDALTLWLYVRCLRCGAPLAVRVDLRNEPTPDYDTGGFILHKEMMDGECFTLMRAQVRLDANRKVVEQSIEKGEFISREQYEQMSAERSSK